MKKTITLIAIVLFSLPLSAQIGGRYVYEFLGQPSSARVTALGGSLVSVIDEDVTLAYNNPALLNAQMHKQVSFNHNFHFADISNGYFSYGHTLSKYNLHTHLGINYIRYGEFQETDEFGNILGSFKSGETAITLGAGKMINERISLGGNIKAVFAGYESYNSTGIAMDLGATYSNVESRLVMSFVIRNLGTEIATFNEKRYAAPLDIQIGLSKKLAHLPLRFSVTAHQLQKWGIRYDDPNRQQTTDLFGEEQTSSAFSQGVDNFFRHFIFSGEILLGKHENLKLRVGYNHLRRKELSVTEFKSLGGFSLGFGLKINRFRIDYGVGYFHLGGASNHISLSTNLTEFTKPLRV